VYTEAERKKEPKKDIAGTNNSYGIGHMGTLAAHRFNSKEAKWWHAVLL